MDKLEQCTAVTTYAPEGWNGRKTFNVRCQHPVKHESDHLHVLQGQDLKPILVRWINHRTNQANP